MVDVSLYTRVDDALSAMDVAFQSLVSCGLAQEDEEVLENPERNGVVVYAREIGVQASAALQAISRLKQTAVQSDWRLLADHKRLTKRRLDSETERTSLRTNKLKHETRNLVKTTETHFLHFPKRPLSEQS